MKDYLFVFDKDGVIVDTEATKLSVFEALFSDYPEYTAQIKAYNRSVVGKARLEKFTHIYHRIIGHPKEVAEQKAQTLVDQSFTILQKKLREISLVPGVKDFIRITPNLKFVCSAALAQEIEDHIYGHQLSAYFEDWFAFPERKADVLWSLKKKYGRQVVFWGDQLSDYAAAKEAETHFIGVIHSVNSATFEDIKIPLIKDFRDREHILSIVEGFD